MNKLRIVKSFVEGPGSFLDFDQVRLYLFLVADSNCAGAGRITRRTITAAMGEDFVVAGLRLACQALAASELVEFPDGITGEPKEQFSIRYRIID